MQRNRTLVIAMAAALCLTAAGCSSAPSSDRYIGAGSPEASGTAATPAATDAAADGAASPDASPSPAASAANADSASSQAANEAPAAEAPPGSAEPAASPSPSKAAEPAKKPAAPAKKAQQNNASVNKAVADSILSKNGDSAAKSRPADAKLTESIEQIRGLVKDLKQQTENGDAEKIADLAGRIARSWDGMKSGVAASYSDMSDFLQGKIDKLADQTGADSLDLKALLQLDYELYQGFRQLADKAAG